MAPAAKLELLDLPVLTELMEPMATAETVETVASAEMVLQAYSLAWAVAPEEMAVMEAALKLATAVMADLVVEVATELQVLTALLREFLD